MTIQTPSDDRPTRKQQLRKTKCVPNDRSRREDQFCPKIVKGVNARSKFLTFLFFWPQAVLSGAGETLLRTAFRRTWLGSASSKDVVIHRFFVGLGSDSEMGVLCIST